MPRKSGWHPAAVGVRPGQGAEAARCEAAASIETSGARNIKGDLPVGARPGPAPAISGVPLAVGAGMFRSPTALVRPSLPAWLSFLVALIWGVVTTL